MAYDSHIHHRHSIRLKNYDYSKTGAYLVTICTHNNRECLFGEIVNGVMVSIGKIRNEIELYENEFVVMPNHINQILKTPGASIWQRNYHEHIIRNEIELNKI